MRARALGYLVSVIFVLAATQTARGAYWDWQGKGAGETSDFYDKDCWWGNDTSSSIKSSNHWIGYGSGTIVSDWDKQITFTEFSSVNGALYSQYEDAPVVFVAENPEYGTSHDTYTIFFNPIGGSSYSNRYVVAYNMDDMSLGTVAFDGREHLASLKSFSDAEATERLDSDKAAVLSKVQELYGLDNPDSVRSEVYFDLTDSGENDVRQNRYVITYGSTEVDLIWDIGTREISSIEFVRR